MLITDLNDVVIFMNGMNNRIKELEKEVSQLKTKNNIKVKYVGNMDFHDGLTTGGVYSVIEILENQFVVHNDLGGTSTMQKSKFEIA